MLPDRETSLPLAVGFLLGVFLTLAVIHYATSSEPLKTGGLLLVAIVTGFAIGALGVDAVSRLRDSGKAWYDGQQGNAALRRQQPGERGTAADQRSPDSQMQQPDHEEASADAKAARHERKAPTKTPTPKRNRVTRVHMAAGTTERVSQRTQPHRPSTAPFSEDYSSTDPSCLIDVWESYWKEGDGHFTVTGLSNQMKSRGIHGRVVSGRELGADDSILGVDLLDDSGTIYLLPNFNKPPRAVKAWFADSGSHSLAATVKRINKLALGHRNQSGTFELDESGEVG